MSLKTDALTIKNETTSGANTATRIGGLFENIAKVTETVDTIADLRAFDTSILSHGDVVKVKSHSSAGLDRRLGEGKFVLNKNGLFSINNVGGYSAGNAQTITTTPTTTGFALPADGGYTSQLPKVVFESGTIGTFWQTSNLAEDRDTVVPTGSTSLIISLDGAVADGEKAYFVDDDGLRIRPTFTGFSGDACWERDLPNDVVTPEMWGAIPNYTSFDGAVNECSGAIQSAFDSEYNVRMFGGQYYINTPVVLEKGKTVYMPYSNHIEWEFTENRRTMPEDWSNGSIYITTNIDMVVIRSRDVKWYGGILDARQAPSTKDKAGFRYDMSASLAYSDIFEAHVIGDTDHLVASADNGITAVLIDTKNIVDDDSVPNTRGIGALYFNKLRYSATRCHTAFHYNEAPVDNTLDYFANSIDVDIISLRNKRMYYMEQNLSVSKFTGYHQAGNVLQPSQEDWAASVIDGDGNYYDVYHWDMTPGLEDGLYTNTVGAEFLSDTVKLGPLSLLNPLSIYKGLENIQGYKYEDFQNTDIVIPASNEIENTKISRLTNQYAFFNKRHRFAVTAYDGSAYNFSTLEEVSGLTQPTDINITDADSIVDLSRVDDCVVEFEATANGDTDFIEIVLEDTGSVGEGIWGNSISITLDFDGQKPKRIQKFLIDEAGAAGREENIYPLARADSGKRTFTFSQSAPFNTSKLIFRLIGFEGTGIFRVDDIYAADSSPRRYLPYIHTGGGQTIEGSLTVGTLDFEPETLSNGNIFKKGQTNFRVEADMPSADILAGNDVKLISESDYDIGNPSFNAKGGFIEVTGGDTDYPDGTILEITGPLQSGPFLTLDIGSLDGGYHFAFEKQYSKYLRRFSGYLDASIQGAAPATGNKDIRIYVDFEVFD